MKRILHVLAQRPGLTGSGVTLNALVRETAATGGWDQHAVVGVPVGDDVEIAGLEPERIHALRFGPGGDLPFPVPGMSDVMPYESTVFSEMTPAMTESYCEAWLGHLRRVAESVHPDVVHVHHIWLVGSLIKDALPGIPVVSHCHATGLRQAELTPHLAARVRMGNARNDAFAVLHEDHRTRLTASLGLPSDRVKVVGAGFRDDMFPSKRAIERVPDRLAYVGKLSAAKGVDELLTAVEILTQSRPNLELHMAGGGSGKEAERLRARCETLGRSVVHHGFVDDDELTELLASASVFVLPSYYEGLPLVLVEAAASGCRLVATELAGVKEVLAPHLGELLHTVPLPAMATVDTPEPDALAAHARVLARSIDEALASPAPDRVNLDPFRWSAVAARVQAMWSDATS